MEDKDIKRALHKHVAPVASAAARDLLGEMLKRNPASRCDLQHVIVSNFLRGDATLGVIQEHYKVGHHAMTYGNWGRCSSVRERVTMQTRNNTNQLAACEGYDDHCIVQPASQCGFM